MVRADGAITLHTDVLEKAEQEAKECFDEIDFLKQRVRAQDDALRFYQEVVCFDNRRPVPGLGEALVLDLDVEKVGAVLQERNLLRVQLAAAKMNLAGFQNPQKLSDKELDELLQRIVDRHPTTQILVRALDEHIGMKHLGWWGYSVRWEGYRYDIHFQRTTNTLRITKAP